MTDSPAGPRIWIDGFPLAHPKGTGITTYARGIARTLRDAQARLGLHLAKHSLQALLRAVKQPHCVEFPGAT
jgi:hypothetical protein